MFEKISEFSDSKKGFYFVLIVALIIKIITLIIMHDMAINRDGTQYIAAAQQFAKGNFAQGFAFHSMPFYPLIITLVNFIVGNWLVSARLISIISLKIEASPSTLPQKEANSLTSLGKHEPPNPTPTEKKPLGFIFSLKCSVRETTLCSGYF